MGQLFSWITMFFAYIINMIYGLVNNYGLAIILFTILIKIILLPLSIKQHKSQIAMQRLTPLTKDIQKKYAHITDKNERSMKIQQETQKLHKEHNVNMFSGCLPTLIQLPILIILYQVITRPLTYILGMSAEHIDQIHTALENLGVTITKGMEMPLISQIAEHPEVLTGITTYRELNFGFLGLNLASTPSLSVLSPLWIIPILAGFFTWLSSKMLQPNTKTKEERAAEKAAYKKAIAEGKDPEVDFASQSQSTMTAFMPLMLAFFAFSVPAGVGLYWVMSNVTQIIQQLLLKKAYAGWAQKLPPLTPINMKVDKPKKKRYTVKKKK